MANVEALKKLASDDVNSISIVESVKKAQAKSGIWGGVMDAINAAKKKWDELDPSYKPLVGSLVGGGVGAGAGALAGKMLGFGAGHGALAGLGLGGIGGALYGSGEAGGQIASEKDRQIENLAGQIAAKELGAKLLDKGKVPNPKVRKILDINKQMSAAKNRSDQQMIAKLKARLSMLGNEASSPPQDDVQVDTDL